MTDWNYERVRALVSAAEDAVQRTRSVFLVVTLGCAVMITAQIKLYGSWVRHVRERAYLPGVEARYGEEGIN
jgi:tartrate dehydratase beta subunit/fumarate hydratase class I family protein